MEKYLEIFLSSFGNYWNYLWNEITHPHWKNYFYWLIALSLFFWMLEMIKPWRKKQSIFRRDFWLDGFYMFFNFFLFSLIGYAAFSNIFSEAFNDFLSLFGITNIVAVNIQQLPVWAYLILLFILKDFISWSTHVMLHRVPFLWEFHKVHHSVREMGFAAHLRYHWMENIVYKLIQFIPLGMLGFDLIDFFIMDLIAVGIGHFNHANFRISLGPFKYIFNSPQMHIWHHAKHLPKDRKYGVNYAISLSIWDYLFGTNYIPRDGRDEELGFDDVEHFPDNFAEQAAYPFIKRD